MARGRVIKLTGGRYTVYDFMTEEMVVCQARGKLRATTVDKHSSFNKQVTHKTKLETKTIKLSPKVGDIVSFELAEGTCFIDDVEPRKNELDRPVISNVDQILLIFSAKKPDFSFSLLDQFLVLLEKASMHGIIIVTKIDLITNEERSSLEQKLSYYEKIGYEVFYVNSKNKEGFEAIQELFTDRITVLAGQTGAGKSTFINALIPGFELQTQEISEALGRGKHTTRHTELYQFHGGFIGDTPGFSKLDFSLIQETELKEYFVEFSQYPCKYRGCVHQNEPHCAVKEALEAGELLRSRYENYSRFYEEIKQTSKKY